jgi:3-dehydroquinate synthase
VSDRPVPEEAAVAVLRAIGAPEPVGLGAGVWLGRGALGRAGEILTASLATPKGERAGSAGSIPVVTDVRVWSLHGRALAESLRGAGREAVPVELPEGEAAKAPESLLRVWRALAAIEAGRDTPLAVLGGGAVGDVGGLAAATFKRGLPLALFPTTLLAQVDAAIGGKNAIDLDGIKNAVGTFHDPALVAIDPLCPLTQAGRDWRAGWAEIVKSALVGDPELFELCEREVEGIGERRLAVVEEGIRRAATVKLGIVGADPREAGPRQTLNLGHTLGHAFESAADGSLLHGEAVSIGLVLAARLSEREGVAEAGLAERIEAVLSALGLPVRPPAGLDPGRVLALARQDKKRRSGAVHAVLPARPGSVEIRALDDAALERWIGRSLESGFARAGSSR